MCEGNPQYIFPELERTVFIKSNFILVPLELILHAICIGTSVVHQNLDGVYISLFFAVIFAIVHFQNLLFRKYCLAKWSFDGIAFYNHIGGTKRALDVTKPFCLSFTTLSFNRRYSFTKYPFLMIWKPGMSAPYADMNGYVALKKRDAILIPFDDKTCNLLSDLIASDNYPEWPRSGVYNGITDVS